MSDQPSNDNDDLSDEFEYPLAKKPKQSDKSPNQEVKSKPLAEKNGRTRTKKLYQCQHCSATFIRKFNCRRHSDTCLGNNDRASNRFVCDKCSFSCNRKDNLRSHSKHCKGSEQAPPRKKPCLIKGCDEEFVHHIGLIEHLRSIHKNEVVMKPMVCKKFPSINHFNVWKEKEETETFSYFCKRRGTESNGDQHFYCQHDGSNKLHSERKTSRRNLKGRVKVGHHCIAKMIARIDPKSKAVNLEYHPTHSHLCRSDDFLHHPLPSAMSRFIDKKLAENIPPCVVYELTKAQFLPKNDLNTINPRSNILTKKRILERGRRRRIARRLHKDDAKAVFLLVKQLIEKDDSILLYKPYGSGVEHGPPEINGLSNCKDLFMLGIQTQRQLELFKKHCAKVVILDETHGTNQYKYQLLTAMVVDENRRGWPIAHLLTNKSDGENLHYFFKCLKLRLGDEDSVGCVITDDDPALINGMSEGFSEHLKHILCIWHVFKNLKDGVKSKASKGLFESMMSEVKLIMNVKQETVFSKLCSGFVKKYENNQDAVQFVEYFQKYYLNRSEKWAMCFRNFPHAEVNTTGHLESFHNRLKKFYLKRRVNKRLDDLIHILLDVEWDDHCTRQREASVGFSSLPQPMWERHQRGLAMDDDTILENILENTWEVKSASGKSISYIVVRHKESCTSDFCFSKCLKLECHGLCAHLFSCSCPDHHPICKHVHKLQSVLTRGQPDNIGEPDFYCLENFKNNEDFIIDSEPSIECNEKDKITGNDKKLETMISRLRQNYTILGEFINAVEQMKVPEHTVTHADALLADWVSSFGSVDYSCDDEEQLDNIAEMTPAVKFAPNEKLQTQLSQLASFKRPKKRRSKLDAASLAEKKKTAMESLLRCAHSNSEDDEDVEALDSDSQSESYESFTPPSLYVSDPFDHILVCGDEKISLIALKSLELQFLNEEQEKYFRRDAIFKCGHLYSSIINAFLFKLCLKFEQVCFVSGEFALRAARRNTNIHILNEYLDKKVMFVPANFTGDQWCIFAIMTEEGEIRFYDPSQSPLSQQIITCLIQTVSDLKALYPLVPQWKIKLVRVGLSEDGGINSGPQICNFAEQTAQGKPYSTLESPYGFRKYMYRVIVGNCIKRSSFFEEACGRCGNAYSQEDPQEIWICCLFCQQWFHDFCVNRFSDQLFFSCP